MNSLTSKALVFWGQYLPISFWFPCKPQAPPFRRMPCSHLISCSRKILRYTPSRKIFFTGGINLVQNTLILISIRVNISWSRRNIFTDVNTFTIKFKPKNLKPFDFICSLSIRKYLNPLLWMDLRAFWWVLESDYIANSALHFGKN